MFVPESINQTIGFRNYLRWIKENHAVDKPVFIGETGGLSVSQAKLNNLGFGGGWAGIYWQNPAFNWDQGAV